MVVAVPWILESATVLGLVGLLLRRFGLCEYEIPFPEVVAVLVTPFLPIFVEFCLFVVFGLGVTCLGVR